ncbi:MAG: uracil-DNA glycosylase family protein [Oxalobacter sp.]
MKTLDNATRLAYLKEMGITLWSRRTIPADDAVPETLPSTEPEDQAFRPVASSPEAVSPVSFIQVDETVPAAVPDTVAWEQLLEEINHCQNCHLCQTRNKIVPGVGDRSADWLFVGEGPGYFEDQQGEPFVGRSGKLLDNMLAGMLLKRGTNVYIANIVKCRASEAGKDRQPTEEESAICMPFLERQIALINPKIIVALGKTAATALLNTSRENSLSSMRRKIHYYQSGERQIPLVITYHPSYLLRTPQGKQQAWEDLCMAMETLESSNI